MKIVICGSIIFTPKMKEVANHLTENGYEVELPFTSQKIINGELTLEEFKREKENNGDGSLRKVKDDLIKRYYEIIKGADAVLVVNLEKNNITNYIGGNTFLEMGFAHVLNKKIYLYNDIPDLSYTDEIKAMQPTALREDLSKLNDI